MNKITNSNANAIGATITRVHVSSVAHKFAQLTDGRPQNSRGITLIALIITIIVMLILAGVSISIAINGGLFDITRKAAKETENAKNAEQELANGRVKINEIWYDSIEDYVEGKQSENQTNLEKPVEPEKPIDPESYLGRTATIDGQKYIVLYEPGEKIEMEDYEYEMPYAQLISANVLEANNLYLEDLIDWTDTDVVAEADVNEDGTLESIEKVIYSYNHVVEALNNKCEELADITNSDIVTVRSVGSYLANPLEENSEFYESDLLEEGCFVKGTDQNYVTDYDRMKELGITEAENSEDYWIPSRSVDEIPTCVAFSVRYGSNDGYISSAQVWTRSTNGYLGFPVQKGVRPVISLWPWALNDYLD